MYFDKYKIIDIIAHNTDASVYKCILLHESELFIPQNELIFKRYRKKKPFIDSFERTDTIILASHKIYGMCNIIGTIHKKYILAHNKIFYLSGILMEYVKGINLDVFIASEKYDVEDIKNICKQLLYTLKCLNEYGLMHRDIKPLNVMITPDKKTKLIDFTNVTNKKNAYTRTGTPIYMAPEILMHKKYNNKCDVYSFGILLYKLVEKEEIYDVEYGEDDGKSSFSEELKKLANGYSKNLEYLCRNKIWYEAPILYKIIKKCLRVDPKNRPTFGKIYKMILRSN